MNSIIIASGSDKTPLLYSNICAIIVPLTVLFALYQLKILVTGNWLPIFVK